MVVSLGGLTPMVKRGKTEKLSITLPHDLVEEIRKLGPEGGMSGYLARAAQDYLARERLLKALEIGRGAWKDEDHPDLMTPEDTVRFIRQLRESDADRERDARLEKLWNE